MNHVLALRKPPAPLCEEERMLALTGSGLLDSQPEEGFDAITIRAQATFNVPIALISLVDRDRQWFKSRCGVDIHETSRDTAFCAYTILSDQVMVVLNARRDERFAQNPLVTGEPHIRFYAGAPIIVPDGLILGTLCIIDTEARDDFSQEEKACLAGMANQVSLLIQKKMSE